MPFSMVSHEMAAMIAAGDRQYSAGIVITHGQCAWPWPLEGGVRCDLDIATGEDACRTPKSRAKPHGVTLHGIKYCLSQRTRPRIVGFVTSCAAAPAICAGMVSTTPTNSSDTARTIRRLLAR